MVNFQHLALLHRKCKQKNQKQSNKNKINIVWRTARRMSNAVIEAKTRKERRKNEEQQQRKSRKERRKTTKKEREKKGS